MTRLTLTKIASIILSILSIFPTLTFAQPTCNSLTFSNKINFQNCINLPTLNSILHYTYNPTNLTLSIAFTARPPNPNGWIAWGLNPNGSGMVGAQAMLAYKPTSNSPISISTYDLKSYHDITMGNISYNVTNLSAEELDGVITVFATWWMRIGVSDVNHVWQVGQIIGGKPGKHEFMEDNLGSKMKLRFSNGPGFVPVGANGA